MDNVQEYQTPSQEESVAQREDHRAPEDLQPRPPPNVGSLTNGSMASNASSQARSPFGGVAMPGMAAPEAIRSASPAPSFAPPPPAEKPVRPPSVFGRPTSAFGMQGPAPTGPSAIRPSPSMTEEDDPIARSLAELRRDPPPAGSIRRGHSQRRPESVVSTHPASRQSYQQPPKSPGPGSNFGSVNRQSYQGHAAGRPSMDAGLIPPMAGHTAADLARSRAEHDQRSSRAFSPAPGQDYHAAAANVVGAHPASRPATPSAQPTTAPRAPSPAFMQPPAMAPSPVDEVLGQYHQAFPGERSRSRAGSFVSTHSRQQSFNAGVTQTHAPSHARSPSPAPREGFVGIGAGRSPSPQPQQFQTMSQPHMRAPSPQPGMRAPSPQPGMRAPSPQPGMRAPSPQPNMRAPSPQPDAHRRGQSYSSMNPPNQGQQVAGIASPISPHAPNAPYGSAQYQGRPTSTVGQPMSSPGPYGSVNGLNQFGSVSSFNPQSQFQQQPQSGRQHPGSAGHEQGIPHSASSVGHGDPRYQGHHQSPITSPPPGQSQYQTYGGPVIPASTPGAAQYANPAQSQNPHYRAGSTQPGPVLQQNPYQRAASPAPAPVQMQSREQQYQPPPVQTQQPAYGGYQPQQPVAQSQYGGGQFARGPSPAPQQFNRSPSPVPPAPPADTPPTGQYSTTGEPVLFCEFLCLHT